MLKVLCLPIQRRQASTGAKQFVAAAACRHGSCHCRSICIGRQILSAAPRRMGAWRPRLFPFRAKPAQAFEASHPGPIVQTEPSGL